MLRNSPNGTAKNFKVILIGDCDVGKTCVAHRFAKNSYEDHKCTLVDTLMTTIQIDKQNVNLNLWDTCGHERFFSLTKTYFRGADGAVVIYDITNERSFMNLDKWLDAINMYTRENTPRIILGNKSDMAFRRSIETARAQKFAKLEGALHMEVSARNASNIRASFMLLAGEMIYRRKQLEMKNHGAPSIKLANDAIVLNSSATLHCCDSRCAC